MSDPVRERKVNVQYGILALLALVFIAYAAFQLTRNPTPEAAYFYWKGIGGFSPFLGGGIYMLLDTYVLRGRHRAAAIRYILLTIGTIVVGWLVAYLTRTTFSAPAAIFAGSVFGNLVCMLMFIDARLQWQRNKN